MDQRFIFAILRRVLPPGVTLPSPDSVILDAAGGTLRVTHLRIAFGETCLGTLFGVSIRLPQLSVVCECAEVHLRLTDETSEAAPQPAPAAVAATRGAHDAAAAAAIDSLLQWLVQLTASSTVEVHRLVLVAEHPAFAVGLGVVVSQLALRSSGDAPAGYAAALGASVADVSVHIISLSDAVERRANLAGDGRPEPFGGPSLISVSALQAAYGVPVLRDAMSKPATLRFSAQAVAARVDVSTLVGLLATRSRETVTTAPPHPFGESVPQVAGSAEEAVTDHLVDDTAAVSATGRSETTGDAPARAPNPPSGGLFSAARELWTAVWTGADSVHVKPEAVMGSTAAAAAAPAAGLSGGALERLTLGSPEIDDAGYDDLLEAGSGRAATANGAESVLRASMFASFSAPPRASMVPPPLLQLAEHVATPRVPHVFVGTSVSLSIRRANFELRLNDLEPTAARMPPMSVPAVVLAITDAEASWIPDDGTGKVSFGWNLLEMHVVALAHGALSAISDTAAHFLLQDLKCNADLTPDGITARVHLVRTSLALSSLPQLVSWLSLSTPAINTLSLSIRTHASDEIMPSVEGTQRSPEPPTTRLILQGLSVDQLDVSCGLAVPGNGDVVGFSAALQFQLRGVDMAPASTMPRGAAVAVASRRPGAREFVCSVQRLAVVLDGTDESGAPVGSPIPCITIAAAPTPPELVSVPPPSASEVWIGTTHIAIPWSVTALASNAAPALVAEAANLQHAVSLLTASTAAMHTVPTAVTDIPPWRVYAGRIQVTLSILPEFSSADLDGAEGCIEALLIENDAPGGLVISCCTVAFATRERTSESSPRPVLAWGSRSTFSGRRCLSLHIEAASRSTTLTSTFPLQRVRAVVMDLVVFRSLRLAEFVAAAARVFDYISPPAQEQSQEASPPRQSHIAVLHFEMHAVHVSEVDADTAAVLALSSVVADVLPLGWGSLLEFGVEVTVDRAAVHVLRREDAELGDFARRCSGDPAILTIVDCAALYSIDRRELSAALGDVAGLAVALTDDALLRLHELAATVDALEQRVMALVVSFSSSSKETRASALENAVSAAMESTHAPQQAPQAAPTVFGDSTPVYSLEQQHPGAATQRVGGSDWEDPDVIDASPAGSPAPVLRSVVSSDFESSALVVEARLVHTVSSLGEHAAVLAYVQATQLASGVLSPALTRLCRIDLASLEPNSEQHSSEEWALGCVPAQASSRLAHRVLAATLRSVSVTFDIDRVSGRTPFRGLSLDVLGMRALYAQFRTGAAVASARRSPFGWELTQRAGLIVDDFRATDALGENSAAQDGQGSTLLISKAVSGAQQVATRCIVQWVSPTQSLLGDADSDAEMRVWLDIAPVEVDLRGRVVLLAQRLLNSNESSRAPGQQGGDGARGSVPGSTATLAASTAVLSAQQQLPARPLFFQLVCLSQQRVIFSFTPEPGMTQLSLGGDGMATVPLLPVDRLDLLLRSVRVCSATGLDAALRAILDQYSTQAQERQSLAQLFTSVPASIIPFAPRIAASIAASFRLATTVAGRAAGAAAGAGGEGGIGSDPGWLATVQHVSSAVYDAGLPAASAAATVGARVAMPVATALLDSVVRGGRAVMAAAGFSGAHVDGSDGQHTEAQQRGLGNGTDVSGSSDVQVDWQHVLDD